MDGPCDENAQCVDTDGSFVCVCDVGFTLSNTGDCIDINECAVGGHNCENEERCLKTP